MSSCLAVIGLCIDVVGAFVLAIPDLPRVRRIFKFGRIKQGRQKIMGGGLEIADAGHSEIVEIYDDIKNGYGFTAESVKKIRAESISKPVFQGSEVVNRKPRNSIEVDIDPNAMNKDSQITQAQDPSFKLLDRIDSEIEAGQQRFRRAGIGLLMLGFILQIPQYIL